MCGDRNIYLNGWFSHCKVILHLHTYSHTYQYDVVEETDVSPLCPEVEDSLTASQTFNRPKLRPPIPPPKKPSSSPSPPPMIEEAFYEDPQVFMNKSPKLEDSIEEVYDNIDEANAIRDLNKFPPPVWKQGEGLLPPPLPPMTSHPARRYTRSFNQSSEFVQVNEWRAAATKRMPEKIQSNKPTVASPKHKKHFGSLKDSPRMPKHEVKTKPPTPPTKPWKSGSSDDLLTTNSSELLGGGRDGRGTMTPGIRGVGFNLKNDPKFGKKLQERRQEIYGDTPEKSRPRSWGHDQEAYEEVPFTASDDDLLGDQATRGRRGAGPLNYSDEEYVDCQPHEDDEGPAAYLEHNSSPERRIGKGPNTLKREEFLRRPPLPLPPHSSAGNPIPKSPPKKVGSSGSGRPPVAAALVRPPVASSAAGTNAPPPIPKRGNERPPMPLPGAVVDGSDDDEAPPVPRRHPHASDKHRAFTVGDSNSPSGGLSPPGNAIPLPPRSLSPSSSPYPSPMSGDNAPPLPQRGPRQFDSPSSAAKKPKPPPPILKQRSLSPEDLASAKSDHVFEPFTFGLGPPSIPNTLPQTKKSNKAKPNPPVPAKNLASTIGGTRPSYETKLPADIGMKPSKKKFVDSYETNLPASIGNRPPLQTKRPETAATPSSSNTTTKPRPPIKPPVAAKPTQPKSPPHAPVKPQVSKKPTTGQYPTAQPKPPTLTPKPAAGTTNLASRTNFTNKGGVANSTSRTFNSDSYNSQPHSASKPVRTRNDASKPPAPPGKPKPLLPPSIDRRKQLPTPSY